MTGRFRMVVCAVPLVLCGPVAGDQTAEQDDEMFVVRQGAAARQQVCRREPVIGSLIRQTRCYSREALATHSKVYRDWLKESTNSPQNRPRAPFQRP